MNMYEIKPESIKTFITDRNVKLPRFQRKQTWDEKKNFELCISLFKKYPIGVSILSVDTIKGSTVRWLLDGRQRRNALTRLYEDPENIYYWAKKFIGFKNSDQLADVSDKFWAKVNEYIDADDDDQDSQEPILDSDIPDTTESNSDYTEETNTSLAGLDLLLEIIKMVHNKQTKCSGFTRHFDFGRYVEKLPYYDSATGNLLSREVRIFIDNYRDFCSTRGIEYSDKKSFSDFINNRYSVKDDEKLKQFFNTNWKLILERIEILDKIDALLSDSSIGLILARNLSPTDSQKIFNIINSKGEKLTAVEVLSAKPSWNEKIDSPTEDMRKSVKHLYTQIGTVYSDIVRWDLCATFAERWGENFIISNFTSSKSDFEKKITIGFKILAGIYEKGVKKESIEKLSKNTEIRWNTDYETIVRDFQSMSQIIGTSIYFRYFKSWRTTIMDITSDAVALNFALTAYRDWSRKDKPIGTDAVTRKFQKNCFILLDKLVYEYVLRQWHGASDQKIANNLEVFDMEPEIILPVAKEKWEAILTEIFDSSRIADIDISPSYMKTLLYHFYCMKNQQGPDTDCEIELDHIIPQDTFNNSTVERKEVKQHNILNLGLLPKNENISKGKKRLIEINNNWMRDQIEKYEYVSRDDFALYSDLANLDEIFTKRKELFYDAYLVCRDKILNN